MAEAGCYGPQCTFLGSASDSQATPGICTGTAGYIANAEILGILANSSRVNQNFVDSDSNTNILVYDETQWVGWMSDSVKAQRKALYQGLSMGGTSDWATDLQAYNPPPYTANNWGLVINDVVSGGDPYAEGPRTGNWTSLNCDDPAIQDALHMPCAERWAELDAANAWSDTMNIWFTNDSTQLTGYNAFTLSMFNTWHITESANCRETAPDGYCDTPLDCAALQGFGLNTGGSGPAVEVLYESIALINSVSLAHLASRQDVMESERDVGFTSTIKVANTTLPLRCTPNSILLSTLLLDILTASSTPLSSPLHRWLSLKATSG
jgi:hypothetical protein